MRKLAATIGFLLLLSSPLSKAEAVNLDEPAQLRQ